ncbi:OmpA family protein [Algivirga pacifica]
MPILPKIQIIFSLILLSLQVYGQNVPFESASFPEKKEDLKRAKRNIREADGLISIEQNYKQALKLYLRAYRFNPSNQELCFKIGECYFNKESIQIDEALRYWLQADELYEERSAKVKLRIAQAYHLNSDWDKAMIYLQEGKSLLNGEDPLYEEIKRVEQYVSSGKLLADQRSGSTIADLGMSINSRLNEYGSVIHPDGKVMYYTARRYNYRDETVDIDQEYYEDIYISKRYSSGGIWNRGKNAKTTLNSTGHEAVCSISYSGKTLVLYYGANNGDLYYSKVSPHNPTKVSKSAPFPKPINSPYRETSGCFSQDGNTFYFTSDRKGGKGGLDLYAVERKGNQWGIPTPITTLNTPYNEESPVISKDGTQLYFCSQGHNSIGGYDVFVSELKDGVWQAPENLGIPVNTPFNELYLSMGPSGQSLYLSSDRPEGQGLFDLYSAFLPKTNRTPTLEYRSVDSTFQLAENQDLDHLRPYTLGQDLIYGSLKGKQATEVIQATVTVADINSQQVIKELTTENNRFALLLPKEGSYAINIAADNYLFHSVNVNAALNKFLSIELQPIAIGRRMVLNNLFYEVGGSRLTKASLFELKQIARFLALHPELKVEISGHTDTTGDETFNVKLSHLRAEEVIKFLMKEGVKRYRIKAFGYGSQQPIRDNTTEEGRSENRRIELKIIQ